MPLNADWTVFGTGVVTRATTSAGKNEMSLATNPNNEAAVASPSGVPVIGTGTLRMRVGASGNSINIIPVFPGALATDRGLLAGKIRTVMRWNASGGVSYWGLMALQSALDMTTGTHNAYGLACNTFSSANNIHIAQFDNTILAGWGSLAASPSNTFMDDVPIALEFEWDATSLTSVVLTVRKGSMTDFSDLAPLLSFTDTVSPHVTSVAEGLWGVYGSGGIDVYWDNTTIFKRT